MQDPAGAGGVGGDGVGAFGVGGFGVGNGAGCGVGAGFGVGSGFGVGTFGVGGPGPFRLILVSGLSSRWSHLGFCISVLYAAPM